MSAKPLGRGLDALLGQNRAPIPFVPASGDSVQQIAVERIVPCALQPRKEFDEEALEDLTASIKVQGILQPLVVRAREGGFELIAGERRWRAAQRAGLKEVPVIVRQASDTEMLEWALIENLQRADLNAIEEAEGYGLLQQRFSMTQEQIAHRVGKPRATIANSLRLLGLDATVKALVTKDQLSEGHAKVLLGIKEPGMQRLLAERIVRQTLSVRQTEALVQSFQESGGSTKKTAKVAQKEALETHVKDAEAKLKRKLGTQVRIHQSGKEGKGRIEIDYYHAADLSRLLKLFGVGE